MATETPTLWTFAEVHPTKPGHVFHPCPTREAAVEAAIAWAIEFGVGRGPPDADRMRHVFERDGCFHITTDQAVVLLQIAYDVSGSPLINKLAALTGEQRNVVDAVLAALVHEATDDDERHFHAGTLRDFFADGDVSAPLASMVSRKEELEELKTLVADLRLNDNALDEAVHECAQNVGLARLNEESDEAAQESAIKASEQTAFEINNHGVGGQLRYLLEHSEYESVRDAVLLAWMAPVRDKVPDGYGILHPDEPAQNGDLVYDVGAADFRPCLFEDGTLAEGATPRQTGQIFARNFVPKGWRVVANTEVCEVGDRVLMPELGPEPLGWPVLAAGSTMLDKTPEAEGLTYIRCVGGWDALYYRNNKLAASRVCKDVQEAADYATKFARECSVVDALTDPAQFVRLLVRFKKFETGERNFVIQPTGD
jgi:hypothetical protein